MVVSSTHRASATVTSGGWAALEIVTVITWLVELYENVVTTSPSGTVNGMLAPFGTPPWP